MIINFKDLENIREKHLDKKIIFCGGTFDLLHNGHIEYLNRVKEMGDILVVAISSDKRVKERKGEQRPIHNEGIRVILVDAIRHVDYAFIAPESDKNYPDLPPTIRILEVLKPDIFVSVDSRWLDYKDRVTDFGVDLHIMPISKINSTTSIIEQIKKI